jgi:hypothetical protein
MDASSGRALARAYYNHPAVTYILPEADTREDVLSWFFAAVIPTNVLERGIIRRWINVNRHLESVRRRLADTPLFSATDGDVQSCYVETFDETDLPFYRECGFQIAGAGRIPGGGPNFWILIRPSPRIKAPRGTNRRKIAAQHLSHLRHPMAEAR